MRYVAAVLLLAVSLDSGVSAGEWTRFRGPNGQGVSDAQGTPTEFSPADAEWRVKLPGMGHSSPVVWRDRVFLLSADPDTATRYVLCYSARDGEQLWRRDFESEPHHLHLRSSYASATPAVDAERVYVAWSSPEHTLVLAFDHQGNELWTTDLGPWVSQHGFGTSPVVYEDMVLLANHQQGEQLKSGRKPGESAMVALNKETGDIVWRTPRKSTVAAYSVPCIYRPEGGEDQIICCSNAHGIFSLDPDTGEENWAIDVFRMRTVSSPVIAGGLIFGSTGSGGGGNYVVAVRPPGEEGAEPKVAYQVKSQAPYVPTPVAQGDLLFLWSDKGIVTCLDAPSGQVHWRKRVGGTYSASPIIADGKIYCVSDEGEVVVLAAAKQFKELARSPLGEASRSTPAVSGGRFYLRTYSHLMSFGGEEA